MSVTQVILEGEKGKYEMFARTAEGGKPERVGEVHRMERHTYRTTYTNSRIGYDRTHTCWWGEVRHHGQYQSLRCYASLGEIKRVAERLINDV